MDKELAKRHAEFLADDYRNQIQEILERNPIENLECIQASLIYINEPELLSLVQDLLSDLKTFNKENDDENKWVQFEGKLWREINYFQQVFIQHFLIYNLLQSLFVSRFSPLGKEQQKDLLNKHNLKSRKLRSSLLNFIGNKTFLGKVKNGGSKTNWDKWTRLYFLSLYEKFSIVISNARADYKTLKQKNVAVKDRRTEIAEKYKIPETYFSVVEKNTRDIDKFAREWAKIQFRRDIREEYLAEMGFSDSYLIQVLEQARDEAKNHIPCNCRSYDNHKLLFLTLGDPNFIQHNSLLANPDLKNVKFDSFMEKEHYGMALYFI